MPTLTTSIQHYTRNATAVKQEQINNDITFGKKEVKLSLFVEDIDSRKFYGVYKIIIELRGYFSKIMGYMLIYQNELHLYVPAANNWK